MRRFFMISDDLISDETFLKRLIVKCLLGRLLRALLSTYIINPFMSNERFPWRKLKILNFRRSTP